MTEHPYALLLKLITIYVEGFEVSNITVSFSRITLGKILFSNHTGLDDM